MINSKFRYVINTDIDKISDVDVLSLLLGPLVKRKHIDVWQKKMVLFTYARNPSQEEIAKFLDKREYMGEETIADKLVVREYQNDYGILYTFQEQQYELSLNGFFNFCYRIQKELGLLKNVRCLMRANEDECDKMIFPVIGEFIKIFSAIGRALGLPGDQRIGSDEAYPPREGKITFTVDREGGRGQAMSSSTLVFHMFNVAPIDTYSINFSNRSSMHGSVIFNMKVYTECCHETESEEVHYVDEIEEVIVPSEVRLDLTFEDKKTEVQPKKFGQLKLLISAFAFLYELKAEGIEFENLYLIGCGTGQNNKVIIRYLGRQKNYFLFDPLVVSSTYDDLRREGYNIEVRSKIVSEAQDFLENSVIISDIRSELDDASILRDNYYQWSWARRVRAISMKFKIPLGDDLNRVYNIPMGTVFLQAYRGKTSRETRIFHRHGGMYRHMTVRDYHRKNVYFNEYIRNKGFECYDCFMVKKVFQNIRVPYYAKMIIPSVFKIDYGEDGGYIDLKTKRRKNGQQLKAGYVMPYLHIDDLFFT